MATTYTISYNLNDGSGSFPDQTKEEGVDLVLYETKPTKTGYSFRGWALSEDSTTADYAAGDIYTEDADATLYAVWQIKRYLVTYELNGGSGDFEYQTKIYGEDLVLNSGSPTKTGYTFIGWGRAEEDTTVDFYPGDTYTENSDIILYAIWEANTYDVKYDANGGSGAPEDQTKTYGIDLTLSSIEPTRSGYSFLGWATSKTATSAQYVAGDKYTNNSSVTLYAVWKPYEYIVSYDVNGGIGTPPDQIKLHDVTLYICADENEPTRENYAFAGWSTTRDGEVEYNINDEYTDNEAIILYAVWVQSSKLMMTLNEYTIYDSKARGHINAVETSGTGSEYVVIVEGVDTLRVGTSFTIIPHTVSTSTAPTLNVNGLGAKNMRRRVSGNPTVTIAGDTANWIPAGIPIVVTYVENALLGYWAVDFEKPNANDIYGVISVENGGTGSSSIGEARNNLGLGGVEEDGTGVLSVANGGTGCTNINDLKTAIGFSSDSGIVPISIGGTGATNVAEARNNLGLGNTSGALPIANGGTGATTAYEALNNLGITWGTEEAPETGTPNTIYIQIN